MLGVILFLALLYFQVVKIKFDKKKHYIINKINPNKEYYFELK